MVKRIYIPNRGDIIRLSFDPQSGHEQSGWRPGLVISNKTFNQATGFVVVCPITNSNHLYPFHVLLPESNKSTGVIMVDQMKTLDYIARKAKRVDKVSEGIMEEVLALHRAIFMDDGE